MNQTSQLNVEDSYLFHNPQTSFHNPLKFGIGCSILVSLATPLASEAAGECERVPRVSASPKVMSYGDSRRKYM